MLAPKRSCVGCGELAPEKEGDEFLSSTSGWRLTRRKTPEGADVSDWRCPECWQKYKVDRGPILSRPLGGRKP